MDPNDKAFKSFSSGPGGIFSSTMSIPSAGDGVVAPGGGAAGNQTTNSAVLGSTNFAGTNPGGGTSQFGSNYGSSTNPGFRTGSSADSGFGYSSGSGGDIVINNGVERKNTKLKKPLLILGVAAVVLLIIGGAFLLIGRNRGDSAFTADALTAANTFSNYVYYGENDEASFKAPENSSEEAYLITATNELDSETKKSYLQNLRQYYNAMLSQYQKARPNNPTMAIYRQKMNLFLNFSEYELPTSTEVAAIYAENGEAAASQLVKDAVEHYKNAGEFYGLDYYDLATTWQDKTLEKLKNFSNGGCFNGGVVDYLCAAKNGNLELDTEISNATMLLESVRTQIKADLVMGAAEIVVAVKENIENNKSTAVKEKTVGSESTEGSESTKASVKNSENSMNVTKLNRELGKSGRTGVES